MASQWKVRYLQNKLAMKVIGWAKPEIRTLFQQNKLLDLGINYEGSLFADQTVGSWHSLFTIASNSVKTCEIFNLFYVE
jgi:hypothetical protein